MCYLQLFLAKEPCMKRFFYAVLLMVLGAACKSSTADLSGNEAIEAADFFEAFPPMKLPLIIQDSALGNFGDTATISRAVLAQFVPDSAITPLQQQLGKQVTIRPAGIIHKEERDFLLVKFTSSKKNQLAVFVFDAKHVYQAAFPLLNNLKKDNYHYSMSITEEPTFIFRREKPNPGAANLYSRNGYAYSAATNTFAEVLHDSNEDTARNNMVINPIDTLPATNRFSGDYAADSKNFISVRDGKNALTYTFFIHFEKKNTTCTGELKGLMALTGEKTAVFSESGDPCVINFRFSGNSIIISEEGNCGNHRGITCPFQFTFKKKSPKPASKS